MSEGSKIILNAYEELCSYENFEKAFKKARKGKTKKQYVLEFEKELEKNLVKLSNELIKEDYRPNPLKTFILRDPKTRKISKSDFRDRIVHHAICNIIEPYFEKIFIYDSFANRLGKGTLNSIKRFDEFKRKVSKNNTIRCFVLKADIKSYFESVDHKLLLKFLRKRVNDARIMDLIQIILSNHHNNCLGRGMPLGNLTSQFFANVYLNELDQFIKHKIRAKYYIRYVDDFVILHKSKKILEKYKLRINLFLAKDLKIELHKEKSRVILLNKGVGFLGFRIFYYHKLLVQKNMRKFNKKMKKIRILYMKGKFPREKVIEKFEGWLAYISHANSYKYRKQITSQFNKIFPVNSKIEITSVKKHETFNHKINYSKIDFSCQKTLHHLKQGLNVCEISEKRGIKISTVWDHIAELIEHHYLQLKEILSNYKTKKILKNIRSPDDKLKEIKKRINDDSITYNEINCVLANLKGKHKKKSIIYFIEWLRKANCYRKCYDNKCQRKICREKFQQLAAESQGLELTKKEFLKLFNNQLKICVLSEKDKKKFVSWKKFKEKKSLEAKNYKKKSKNTLSEWIKQQA